MSVVLQAATQGARFKGRLLHLSWYKPKAMATTREAEDDELDEEEVSYWVVARLPLFSGFPSVCLYVMDSSGGQRSQPILMKLDW